MRQKEKCEPAARAWPGTNQKGQHTAVECDTSVLFFFHWLPLVGQGSGADLRLNKVDEGSVSGATMHGRMSVVRVTE